MIVVSACTAKTAEIPKVSGIYAITNKVTGRTYVGQAINMRARLFYHHRNALRKNKHMNP